MGNEDKKPAVSNLERDIVCLIISFVLVMIVILYGYCAGLLLKHLGY